MSYICFVFCFFWDWSCFLYILNQFCFLRVVSLCKMCFGTTILELSRTWDKPTLSGVFLETVDWTAAILFLAPPVSVQQEAAAARKWKRARERHFCVIRFHFVLFYCWIPFCVSVFYSQTSEDWKSDRSKWTFETRNFLSEVTCC